LQQRYAIWSIEPESLEPHRRNRYHSRGVPPLFGPLAQLGGVPMKAAFLFTGTGPIVIVTSYDSLEHPKVTELLRAKGIPKFIAYEIPMNIVAERYGHHYDTVMHSLKETDDLRVLDINGDRAFRLFKLEELLNPVKHEEPPLDHLPE
jgi:hypothetical protein